MRARERKSIESKIDRIDRELKELRLVKQANKERAALMRERRRLDGRLRAAEKDMQGTIVSDHAIVRFMERVHGIDMQEIKREIIGADPKGIEIPNGLFGVDGHKIRVVGGIVVTVLVEDGDSY